MDIIFCSEFLNTHSTYSEVFFLQNIIFPVRTIEIGRTNIVAIKFLQCMMVVYRILKDLILITHEECF